MIPYGRIADTYGRKPVLVMSLLCIGIATSLFGLAHNVWQMIAFRLLAGAGAGTVVTIRTMFSEVSTKKTEARVFSLFATASYMGMFFGPLLGRLWPSGERTGTKLMKINRWSAVQTCHQFPGAIWPKYFLQRISILAPYIRCRYSCYHSLFSLPHLCKGG